MPNTTITKIDRQTIAVIKERTESALREVAAGLGINVTIAGGKFDPSTGKYFPKVEFSVEGAERADWENSIRYLGLPGGEANSWIRPEDYNATFTYQGNQYRLVGVNLRAPKFPFNAVKVLDGKTYRFTDASVKQGLGR